MEGLMKKLLLSLSIILTPINFCIANSNNIDSLIDGDYAQLHHAVFDNNNIEKAKKLLKSGANVDVLDSHSRTPLGWAAERNNTQMMQLFLDHSADVNLKSDGGWTALHVAANDGNIEAVRLLLENNADACIKDDEGETPLDAAKHMELEEKKADYLLIIKELEKETSQKLGNNKKI